MKRIFLPAGSPLPCRTAAHELSAHSGAPVVEALASVTLVAGDVVLTVGNAIDTWPAFAAKVPLATRAEEWELVADADGAWMFAGSTPRNVCRAVLGWIAQPEREANRVSRYPVRERFTMWD